MVFIGDIKSHNVLNLWLTILCQLIVNFLQASMNSLIDCRLRSQTGLRAEWHIIYINRREISTQQKFSIMLRWAVIFLVIAIIAGIFGFTGIAATSAGIAKTIFYIFIILFLLGLILGYTVFKKR